MKASARAVVQKERILTAAEQCFFEPSANRISMTTPCGALEKFVPLLVA